MKKVNMVVLVSLLMGKMMGQQQNNAISGENTIKQNNATAITDTIRDRNVKELQTDIDVLPSVTLSEDEGVQTDGQNISNLLTASRDPFGSVAFFNFAVAGYRQRGYDWEQQDVYLNGVPMNDLERGNASFSDWSGLNDVFRIRDNNFNLEPGDLTFGGLSGAVLIDTRASKQRKQLQVGYAISNRQYRHRLMATYSTGMMKGNWAVSMSFSRRWAQEGFVAGTSFDSYSYFLSVEKIMGKHSLNLTVLGTPLKRGKAAPVADQIFEVTGNPYINSNWGYQDGAKRNARMDNFHQPIGVLTWEVKPNAKTTFITAVSFQAGRRGTTGFDWFNATDPRPDYYRYLPEYYYDDSVRNEAVSQFYTGNADAFQVDWQRLYDANRNNLDSVQDANGVVGNTVVGRRSNYVIQETRFDSKKVNANIALQTTAGNHLTINAALAYQYEQVNNFKVINDLLGGDFFVDVNQFAQRQFPGDSAAFQNDLDNPNRILKVGDRYGYDYDNIYHKPSFFLQAVADFSHVNFFLSAENSVSMYYRRGNMRNGLFPQTSAGNSTMLKFFNYSVKGGLTVKLNGRNFLTANGVLMTKAPLFKDVFLSPRTRNDIAAGVQNELIYGCEAGYVLKSPRVKARATFFFTEFKNKMETRSYFSSAANSFVNFTLNGIQTRHIGGEAGIEASIWKGISLNAAASYGDYSYTARPTATITRDNDASILSSGETVFMNGLKVSGTPQLAANIGLRYNSPWFWFVSLNFNYFDKMYIDIIEPRRTSEAVELVDYGSPKWNETMQQERFPSAYTLDFFGGYSWKLDKTFKSLKKPMYLVLNVGVSNLTNNQFKKFGFETYRQLEGDLLAPNQPSRYLFAQGVNYFISLAWRMN